MPKLPADVSGQDAAKALERLGFFFSRRVGSHMSYKKLDPVNEQEIFTVVPDHKQLAKGTLKSVLRMAEVSIEDFIRALK